MNKSNNQKNLSKKTAVITGGTRGIGKAISYELGRRGANVILNYLRNHKEAKKELIPLLILESQEQEKKNYY